MHDPGKPDSSPSEEAGIARLLRAAGGRDQPSEETRELVRAAAHAEWRAMVRRRKWQRSGFAVAASVAVAAIVALWITRGPLGTATSVVASISRSTGDVRAREGSWGNWKAVTNQPLRAGDSLMTGADGRVALSLNDGVSLRLDHDTRVAWIDSDRIELNAGAIYVDAGARPTAAAKLRVGTPGRRGSPCRHAV